MHYASHVFLQCIMLWCAINSGNTARNTVSPEILANIAKNVASVLSPVILNELHARSNRSFQSVRTAVPTKDDYLDSPSAVNNIIDKTTNMASYYQRNHPYNELYEEGSARLENSQPNGRLQESLRDGSHRRQERPSFFESYDFRTSDENFKATPKSIANAGPLIPNADKSSSNRYSSYHGIGFHKAALAPEPYAGFGGFGPYEHFSGYPHHGHHHHHHHHHPYGSNGNNEPPQSDNSDTPEQNARLENNGSNYGGYGYGLPYFGNHGYHHSYPSFSYGGYGSNHGSFYGPYNGNNSSVNGRNGYGYGPYHTGGFDFYGSPGYGYGYGYGYDNNGHSNGNGNNGSNRQTEGSAESDDQNNSTKNGYPRPYGPPLAKPLLGAFHLQGFPAPFSLLPYEHFHGIFKGGPVVGVGHVGFPIYAEPYPIGFPFHYPYGPIFNGKKYLPPKGKPADSGGSGETGETAPAEELTGNGNPERISALSDKVVPPTPSSKQKRLKMSG